MRWTACELHAHTVHSDGQFTVEGLLKRAKELKIEAVALTDHNADSGLLELNEELEKKYIPVIRGIEWTTYFGHVVVLGADRYVDYRDITSCSIDEKLALIHEAGGLAGIAHPYAVGDPICCGCHWEFLVKNWSLADFIEIWSGNMPQIVQHNRKAIKKWNSLLDMGLKTTGVSARDWHGDEDDTKPFGVTYLNVDENNDITSAAKQAIAEGRAYVTVGPEVEVACECGGKSGSIGDTFCGEWAELDITIKKGFRQQIWNGFQIKPDAIFLVGKGGKKIKGVEFAGYDQVHKIQIPNESPWVRCELHGRVRQEYCEIIITNPVYFI
jgi:hypothetical protein